MRILSLAVIGTLCVVMMISCAQTADPKNPAIKTVVSLSRPATLAARPKAKVLTATDHDGQELAETELRMPPQKASTARVQITPVQHAAPANVAANERGNIRQAGYEEPQPTNSDTRSSIHSGSIQLTGGITDSLPSPVQKLRSIRPDRFIPLAAVPAMPAGWAPTVDRDLNSSSMDGPSKPVETPAFLAPLADAQMRRPRKIQNHERQVEIAGKTPAVALPIAKSRTELKPFTLNSDQPSPLPLSKQRLGERVPDSLRPVVSSRQTDAPVPVGTPAAEIAADHSIVGHANASSIERPNLHIPFHGSSPTVPHNIGNIDSIRSFVNPAVQTAANDALVNDVGDKTASHSVTSDGAAQLRAIHQLPVGFTSRQDLKTVAHHHLETQYATTDSTADSQVDSQVTDLVVGTLRPSSRRVAQVAAQVEEQVEGQVTPVPVPAADSDAIGSRPLPMANPIAIPMNSVPNTDRASIQKQGDLVTLVATDADVRDILRMIAEYHKLNLVIGPEVMGMVTVSIRGARLDEVLDAILGVAGFQWHRSGNLLYVTSSESEILLDPKVQGRRLQVYPLNYVSAQDLEPIVNRLLSPIGKVFTSEADAVDQLKTRELLIVEDIEASHERIAQYIAQIDIPPRQVLVEAHVLQIDLNDEDRCGINLRAIARLSGARVTLEGTDFANDAPEGPSLAFRIAAQDVGYLIEAIHVNTNSRTLASPKVSVVNRQTAKVQIGQRLPYAVSTTTQTATIQNVQFLDVGIVLEVTPVITQDGNILMTVLPKVSGGRITESGFPEEDTTQVSTTVLMPNGSGLVIGGLIRETDSQTTAVVPKLGKIPVIKYLFNKRSAENRRNELVVALVTHIIEDSNPVRQKECIDLQNGLPEHAASELQYAPEIRYSTH